MIEYRQLTTEIEGTKFRNLHNLLFKNTNASLAWFRWYFDKIGGSYNRVYGAFDGDKLAGCWCVEPKVLQLPLERVVVSGVEPNQINVGRCFAVGIHPDYQRRGIFIELSNFAIQQEKARAEFEYILGFPQVGKPVIGGHLKAGWEPIQVINMVSWKSATPLSPTTLSSVEVVRNFGQVSTSPRLQKNVAGFVEDYEYRNQRWLKNPDNFYVSLSKNDAAIVLKPYNNVCHVLDLYGSNSFDIIALLKAAKTLAYRHRWSELTTWCGGQDVHKMEILGAGFQMGADAGLPVQVMAVRINAKSELQFKGEIQFRQGTEEIY